MTKRCSTNRYAIVITSYSIHYTKLYDIKILSGILTPSGGHCEVLGRVPWRDRIAHVAHIGVVFGQRTQLWWDLPVVESFELLAEIYRVPAARFVRTRDELVALLDLEPLLDRNNFV